MTKERREFFRKKAEKRLASERGHADAGRAVDGEAEGLAYAVLELLGETDPSPEGPKEWREMLGRGVNAAAAARRGLYSPCCGDLAADLVHACEELERMHVLVSKTVKP